MRQRRENWLRTGPFHHLFIRRSFQNLGFQYPATSATSHVRMSFMRDRVRAVPYLVIIWLGSGASIIHSPLEFIWFYSSDLYNSFFG
jgi:hypothetical protein